MKSAIKVMVGKIAIACKIDERYGIECGNTIKCSAFVARCVCDRIRYTRMSHRVYDPSNGPDHARGTLHKLLKFVLSYDSEYYGDCLI